MAELPGNSQKPLAFGTICPAAFLLLLIRKKWGWMQRTSSALDVMRLSKFGHLYSFYTPSFSCLSLLFSFTNFYTLYFLHCLHLKVTRYTINRPSFRSKICPIPISISPQYLSTEHITIPNMGLTGPVFWSIAALINLGTCNVLVALSFLFLLCVTTLCPLPVQKQV